MGFVTGTLGFALVAAIAGLCYLLANRRGPFQPGSFLSTVLGLDLAYAGAAPVPATASTPSPANALSAAAASTTPTTPLYSTVNGIDMTGSDIPPDASRPGTIAQTTYGPTGCQAICSSDSRCKAGVYQPSTQLCWMKSAVTPSTLTPNADRVLLPQVTGTSAGASYTNMHFTTGIEALAIKTPTVGDCSSLCQGLPDSVCQGVTFDPDGTCRVKSKASGLAAAGLYRSWLKGGGGQGSQTVNVL